MIFCDILTLVGEKNTFMIYFRGKVYTFDMDKT